MVTQLYSILYEHCPKLTLLDIGDNHLTNRSIGNLCALIVPDAKRTGWYIQCNNDHILGVP